MALLLNFAVGFLAALVGVIPPGLLNMSAAKISMKEGRKKGLMFSVGVCITVMVQTFVALVFARFLGRHPEYVSMLQKVALGIFICITIYFFFIAKDTRRSMPEDVQHSKTGRVFSGMFLAFLNLLPLPYWVYISITFAGFGWFEFSQLGIWMCTIASGIGTFVMLALYVWFFRPKETRKKMEINMNYIIGGITAIISIITLLKIMKEI
ncbi:lysine transporter LysE [Cochleicola gelatinilyticus]|uniref:Lysine transporter LysE n=1 Tax=Cochleicola gelatinilyticus TaxID=1763537 RepID=A0A167IS74_9FLAO|nr:lysine transporter LysE [Cochleicola gelatinilyticus]OAB79961.1 lysine transporter LysE [Cochleicola gelatinilyticus]